jgi:hypothetical protein
VFPKLFTTATQFLERPSITTHIALLDKRKCSFKKKKSFYLLLNIILQKTGSISHNEACVIDWCTCFRLLLMTALTSTSVRVIIRRKELDNCSLFRNCFFSFPFLIIFNFYIIKNIRFQKTVRDSPQIGSWPTSLGNASVEDSRKLQKTITEIVGVLTAIEPSTLYMLQLELTRISYLLRYKGRWGRGRGLRPTIS